MSMELYLTTFKLSCEPHSQQATAFKSDSHANLNGYSETQNHQHINLKENV